MTCKVETGITAGALNVLLRVCGGFSNPLQSSEYKTNLVRLDVKRKNVKLGIFKAFENLYSHGCSSMPLQDDDFTHF